MQRANGATKEGCRGGFRVVVSNDPRSYREAVAAALRRLRPNLDVTVVEPGGVDDEFERGSVDVVLCSTATPVIEARAPVWVDLYPGGARKAIVCSGGRVSTRSDINLRDILDLLDQTERGRALEGGPVRCR